MSVKQILMAAAGQAGGEALYVDDVFSTYLYTGNGSTQTITNGIDLAGEGGLVWLKNRNIAGNSNLLFDTSRGANKYIISNATQASTTATDVLTAFGSTGFTLGADTFTSGAANGSSGTYVSWTFRKQPKFFDVVTFTGDGTTNKVISHNLGATPGFIVVKRIDGAGDWQCWHTTFTTKQTIFLNQTTAVQTYSSADPITVNSTSFTVGTNQIFGNGSGWQYVAYLFAHNAGGFGATGNDNVISCGSFTGPSATVSLGFEPQFVLLKPSGATGSWAIYDVMRGMPVGGTALELYPNLSNAEGSGGVVGTLSPTATGFDVTGTFSTTMIYIAIRRPMKPPTSGTQVYLPIARAGNGVATTVTGVGFAPDLVFEAPRTNTGGNNWVWFDRLRGGAAGLSSDNTGAEFTNSAVIQSDSLSTTMDGFRIQTANPINASGHTYVYYPLKRAPGFFDVVCYTGTGVARTVAHNLAAVPELMIVKQRSGTTNWPVYHVGLNVNGDNAPQTDFISLNFNYAASDNASIWNDTSPTNSIFSVGTNSQVNASGGTFVAYLFASLPGISKVGSYTGNGTSQTINCGFTAGARFVLIKRTDSTGDWFVWDSARGINPAGTNDPYLLLNSTAAEVTTNDSLSSQSVGFGVIQNATTNINVNAASYIFLAIA